MGKINKIKDPFLGTDVDGDPLTFFIVTQPTNANAAILSQVATMILGQLGRPLFSNPHDPVYVN
jgi:hypothetical protein